ncbi:hypothetical protein FACS189454_06110 [Planctomycetales bacterium]|nr:hypothetical protein FACS189454_06110 [Planctomycetales bacterium]
MRGWSVLDCIANVQTVGCAAWTIGTAPTGVGGVLGVLCTVNGIDNTQADLRQFFTCNPVETATFNTAESVTGSPDAARVVDVATGMVNPALAVENLVSKLLKSGSKGMKVTKKTAGTFVKDASDDVAKVADNAKIAERLAKQKQDIVKLIKDKHNYTYSTNVRERALTDPHAHNFPYSYDDQILSTKPKLDPKDGYKKFQYEGTLNNSNGVFEIGVTKEGIIDHRFFRSK